MSIKLCVMLRKLYVFDLVIVKKAWWPFENHCKMKWLPSINKAFIIIIIIYLYNVYVDG